MERDCKKAFLGADDENEIKWNKDSIYNVVAACIREGVWMHYGVGVQIVGW